MLTQRALQDFGYADQTPRGAVNVAAPRLLYDVHPCRDVLSRRRKPIGGLLKRAFDIIVALSALVVLGVFMLMIAVIVKLDSKGPALFLQRRGGFRGEPFWCLKFRTMVVRNEPAGAQVVQAVPNDPRVTRIGAILRKTSMDELPQLVNVLVGQMSIVGPRPHAVVHDREFMKRDVRYTQRFAARPGLTGLAQISGARGLLRSEEDLQHRIDRDLEYVKRWNFFRDLWIILRTLKIVAKDDNAF